MKTGNLLRPKFVGALAALLCAHACASAVGADEKQEKPKNKEQFRGQLGPNSKKIKIEGDKTFIWAGRKPEAESSDWYDFTGSPIPAEQLQFGIGKDRIRSIDDPLFVSADDPRLMKLPPAAYGRDEKIETNDDLRVIGYVVNGEAKAYPTSLLDHHELVNDKIGGKPVTVGW